MFSIAGLRVTACSLALLLLWATSLPARTITFTTEDCDEMASISSLAPRLGWVMQPPNAASVFNPQPTLYWHSPIAVLMRFPIQDMIPNGQRITKAELTIAPHYLAGVPEVYVRRVLAEWGTGVCHQYRMTHPQKIEWSQPGGRGNATDRSNKVSAIFKLTKVGEHTADVTEDIELWYTGAVPNRGWMFNIENDGTHAYIPSPYSPQVNGGKQWKLQVTFEPR